MRITLLVIAGVIAALAIFHVGHYELYCKYRGEPDKSHCKVCGHRRTCQKLHKKG